MLRIKSALEKHGFMLSAGLPMNRYTTMRIGPEAELVVFPRSSEELVEVLKILNDLEAKWMVLGGGSNVIIGSKLDGVVISTKRMKKVLFEEGAGVMVEAGAVLGQVIKMCLCADLIGLEFAAGIPGTMGGGVVMNAGANGGEMKDVIECVWIWHEGRELKLTRDEVGFGYRRSMLPPGSVVTKTRLRLRRGSGRDAGVRVREYLRRRASTQPIETANSGCVFKNPPEIPAGRLLEELGFKGYRIGNACFSNVHANFIVNLGGAEFNDVVRLIEEAKRAAFERRGIILETEVKILGEPWG